MKTLVRPMGAAVVALALLAGGTATAQAYNLSGGHLPTTSPTYKISGGSSASRTAWSSGVSDWANAGAGVSPSTTSGSATVTLSEANDSSVSWDGITNWNNSGDVMTNVSARINAAYTAGYSSDKREGVAAHEVGHTLGLAHSSTCVLMNPTTPDRTNCGVFTPQQDDIDGVQAIYGSNGVGADSQKPAVMHLSQAQSFKNLKSLHQGADAVVLASIGSKSSSVKDGIPFTDHVLNVKTWLKGGSITGTAMVHQTGGLVNGVKLEDDRDPLLTEGQTGIYFLHQYAPGKFFVIGGADGRFNINGTSNVAPLASSNVKGVTSSLLGLITQTQALTAAQQH